MKRAQTETIETKHQDEKSTPRTHEVGHTRARKDTIETKHQDGKSTPRTREIGHKRARTETIETNIKMKSQHPELLK